MTQPTITADLKSAGSATDPERSGRTSCDELLATLTPFRRVVLVSHVNPDPDSLASMLGMQALLESAQPGKPITLTVDAHDRPVREPGNGRAHPDSAHSGRNGRP